MINYPLPFEQYDHYKGGRYEVLTLCTHTETGEKLVIYRSLQFGSVYARPVSQWFDEVTGSTPIPKTRFKKVV